jgi:hypothetical protein
MNASALQTGHAVVDRAFRIAIFSAISSRGRVSSMSAPGPASSQDCDYNKPWTRDGPSTAGLPSASWYLT